MRFCCIICSEDMAANDTVSATTCGHLFHHECLTLHDLHRRFRRHFDCPQCRKSIRLDRDVVRKLCFQPGPTKAGQGDAEDTVQALKSRIKQLEAQLSLAMNDSSRYLDQLTKSESQNEELKSKLDRSERETLDSMLIGLVRKENRHLNRIRRQFTRLEDRMYEYGETCDKIIEFLSRQ